MLIKPDVQRFAKIKVVGLGGGGCNALSSMIALQQIQGVEFVAINTDAQALLANQSPTKVQIGEALTRGLGSGGRPEIGRQAAEESGQKIEDVLSDADMVFLTAGMGGGTGTGSIAVAASVAKKVGALTVAVVTKPFKFEGTRRMIVAEEGLEELKDKVDALIVIPNQRLLEVVDKNMTLQEAFKMADSVLGQGVQGISDLIVMPGLINVDFADVKTIMTDAGSALMGIGEAGGENRAETAARMAIASHLLEVSIEGAKGVLFNVVGGPDLGMEEIDRAAKIIAGAADPDANIIFGATIKDDLVDRIRISVIATGFDQTRAKLREYAGTGLSQLTGMGMPQPQPQAQTQITSDDDAVNQDDTQSEVEIEEPDDEERLNIPAFLRRGN
ncbi:cell division protein FtsZ [Candidatus Daviesbacteria bacterium RIFOXYD1_FULL_41_10]|uniref:Cell division protein FtsZ n=2 Tax=Candidatus Daviesiibacteriota TaxID=1752718 RepID=A0A1F5N0U6_9BACT|nr:MAG: Cell division protein FtsZ [Candidatus Daviesbacteria bacterium GW2011_GWB1_41_5]OGE71110.1 MAG: cell division protein FtsZ [Candidatus Daviesbacteria bacterium RIFOXYD1_FULL_41_10]